MLARGDAAGAWARAAQAVAGLDSIELARGLPYLLAEEHQSKLRAAVQALPEAALSHVVTTPGGREGTLAAAYERSHSSGAATIARPHHATGTFSSWAAC